MKRIAPVVLALASWLAAAAAAPPEVPPRVQSDPGEIAEVVVKLPADKDVGYRLVGPKAAFREMKGNTAAERVFWFSSKAPGTYYVVWWTVGEKDSVTTEITVAAPAPPPAPPGPPQPDPPKPDAAPIAADGLHVLVVYDSAAISAMTEDQKGAIYSTDVRNYLRATCPRTAANGQCGWQMWPANVDASGATKLWQDAYARPRKSLPWVVVSNGKTGYEGALPGSAADMTALLKLYGGGK